VPESAAGLHEHEGDLHGGVGVETTLTPGLVSVWARPGNLRLRALAHDTSDRWQRRPMTPASRRSHIRVRDADLVVGMGGLPGATDGC
jgi:hypothetical protein